MKTLLLCITAVTLALPAFAQDWAVRSDDELFSREDLRDRLAGQTLIFYDDGKSQFGTDGGYSYTYDFGGTAYGVYEIQDDSTVCIHFENGASRCDMYVMNAARLVVLTGEGERFPVRPNP